MHVVETDEEVMRANNGEWPDDEYKNNVLIPKTTKDVIVLKNVVYLMKDIPEELLRKAKANGFKAYILKLTIDQLNQRNAKRIKEEGYDNANQWFECQLEYLDKLGQSNLIDGYIDGNLPTAEIANEIIAIVSNQHKKRSSNLIHNTQPMYLCLIDPMGLFCYYFKLRSNYFDKYKSRGYRIC